MFFEYFKTVVYRILRSGFYLTKGAGRVTYHNLIKTISSKMPFCEDRVKIIRKYKILLILHKKELQNL